jgi:hypothetical protein
MSIDYKKLTFMDARYKALLGIVGINSLLLRMKSVAIKMYRPDVVEARGISVIALSTARK